MGGEQKKDEANDDGPPVDYQPESGALGTREAPARPASDAAKEADTRDAPERDPRDDI